MEVISLPLPTCHLLQGQNTSVRIRLIKLKKPSDTLKTFFKHYNLQTNLKVFSLLIILDLSLEMVLGSPK